MCSNIGGTKGAAPVMPCRESSIRHRIAIPNRRDGTRVASIDIVGRRNVGKTIESIIVLEVRTMWTKPDFTEMRFGFEITMYIGNR